MDRQKVTQFPPYRRKNDLPWRWRTTDLHELHTICHLSDSRRRRSKLTSWWRGSKATTSCWRWWRRSKAATSWLGRRWESSRCSRWSRTYSLRWRRFKSSSPRWRWSKLTRWRWREATHKGIKFTVLALQPEKVTLAVDNKSVRIVVDWE